MKEKITFDMELNSEKKHSNRFDFSNQVDVPGNSTLHPKFKPSFYVPNTHFTRAKKIRVTIEEVE